MKLRTLPAIAGLTALLACGDSGNSGDGGDANANDGVDQASAPVGDSETTDPNADKPNLTYYFIPG